MTEIEIGDIELGRAGEISADTLTLRFDLTSLARGRLRRAEIDRLELNAALSPDGSISLRGLETPRKAKPSSESDLASQTDAGRQADAGWQTEVGSLTGSRSLGLAAALSLGEVAVSQLMLHLETPIAPLLLELAGVATLGPGAAQIILDRCATLAFEEPPTVGVLRLDSIPPIELCPPEPSEPVLRWTALPRQALTEDSPPRIRANIAVAPVALTGRRGPSAPGSHDCETCSRLSLTTPALVLNAETGTDDSRLYGQAQVAGGEFWLEEPALRATDLRAALEWQREAGAWSLSGPLALSELRWLAEPRVVDSFAFAGELDLRGQELRLEGRLRDAADLLELDVTAQYSRHSEPEKARLVLRSAPLVFAPNGLQPAALFPPFPTQLEEVTGSVEGSLELELQNGEVSSQLELQMEQVGFVAQGFPISGISGRVRLSSLAPPQTASTQRIEIAQVRAGTVLSKGVVEFAADGRGELELQKVDFRAAGATVRGRGNVTLADFSGEAPGEIGGGGGGSNLHFEVTGLELEALLRDLDFGNLSGQGTFDGELPIFYREGRFIIRNARFKARQADHGPGGWIRYRSPVAAKAGSENAAVCAEGGVDLAWHLLENFVFSEFEVRADGELAGDIALDLALKGSNPKVCDNHPVEFNLAVELPVASLVRSVAQASAVPESVERALRKRGTKPAE